MEFFRLIKREKLYTVMLAFVLLSGAPALFNTASEPAHSAEEGVITVEDRIEKLQQTLKERFATKQGAEEFIRENPLLGAALSLFILAGFTALSSGLVLLAVFGYFRLRKRQIIKPTFKQDTIHWGPADIFRVVIILVFFGRCLSGALSFFSPAFNTNFGNKAFAAMISTAIYDLFAVAVVLGFVMLKYRQRLKALGISLKNALKNAIVGAAAYVAVLPILAAALLAVAAVTELAGFKPPLQPAVKIFMQESRPAALLYFTAFVSVLGPFAEEVFFRAFAYSALKKRMGISPALFAAAFLFAALHADKIAFLPILILGLLLGWLYEKTGSLIPSFTAHLMHNSLTISFVFLIKQLLNTLT